MTEENEKFGEFRSLVHSRDTPEWWQTAYAKSCFAGRETREIYRIMLGDTLLFAVKQGMEDARQNAIKQLGDRSHLVPDLIDDVFLKRMIQDFWHGFTHQKWLTAMIVGPRQVKRRSGGEYKEARLNIVVGIFLASSRAELIIEPQTMSEIPFAAEFEFKVEKKVKRDCAVKHVMLHGTSNGSFNQESFDLYAMQDGEIHTSKLITQEKQKRFSPYSIAINSKRLK